MRACALLEVLNPLLRPIDALHPALLVQSSLNRAAVPDDAVPFGGPLAGFMGGGDLIWLGLASRIGLSAYLLPGGATLSCPSTERIVLRSCSLEHGEGGSAPRRGEAAALP